jgi:hypothetical protein
MKHLVVDWNGTLCDMAGDSVIMRRITVAILRDALGRAARGRLLNRISPASGW